MRPPSPGAFTGLLRRRTPVDAALEPAVDAGVGREKAVPPRWATGPENMHDTKNMHDVRRTRCSTVFDKHSQHHERGKLSLLAPGELRLAGDQAWTPTVVLLRSKVRQNPWQFSKTKV